jgi:hypothetical protein
MVNVINMKYMHYLGKIPVETAKKSGAVYLLQGVWGCPPD